MTGSRPGVRRGTRAGHRRAGVWSTAVLAVVAGLVLVPPGGREGAAQPPDDPDVRLVVTSLTTTVGPGTRPDDAEPAADADDLELRVLIDNRGGEPVQDLTLSVEVFRPADNRGELHRALDGGGRPPGLLEAQYEDVVDEDPLGPGELAAVEATVPASRIGWGRSTGVHPVLITVLSGTAPLDQVATGVVALDRVPERPLPTTVAWPLDAAPRPTVGDRFHVDAVGDVLPGGRVERLVWALEQSPDTPVQVLAAAHLVEDLEAMADGFLLSGPGDAPSTVPADDPRAIAAADVLDRLRELVGARAAPVVAGAYADAQLAALDEAGFTLDAVRQVTDGRARLERVLGERPRPQVLWATTPVTPTVLRGVLGPAGVDRLVLGWEQLAGGGSRPERTPPPLHELRSGGVQATAAAADPWLQDLLADLPTDHGTPVTVQRIVAETAQAHLERPGAEDGRGLLLLPPADWGPSPRVAADLLAALSRAPWIDPVDLDGLERAFATSPERTLLDRSEVTVPADLRDGLQREADRLAALQDAVTDEVSAVGGHPWSAIETGLRRVPSGWWLPERPSTAAALLGEVSEALDAGFGEVRLPPDAQVTLTDSEGRIPVTVSRPRGPPINVVVELDAPKLDLPEDARLVTLSSGGQQTISFPAVAQASGRIPVTVRVKTPGAVDPEGAPWVELATETLVVRSTVISGTALVILGAVILALLAWWRYRRRRPPSPHLEVVRDAAA